MADNNLDACLEKALNYLGLLAEKLTVTTVEQRAEFETMGIEFSRALKELEHQIHSVSNRSPEEQDEELRRIRNLTTEADQLLSKIQHILKPI